MCGYEQKTVYPVQDIERSLTLLNSLKDIPAMVDGYENVRGYHALLREMANKPNKGKFNSDKNNIRPIFVCPVIKSSFNNVLNMDLTSEIVSEDYLSLVKSNKKLLSSLIVSLYRDFVECLFPEDGTEEDRKAKYLDGVYPFPHKIADHIHHFRTEYAAPFHIAKNTGILGFFFFGIMRAMGRAINTKEIPFEKAFAYSGQPTYQSAMQHLLSLVRRADKTLFETHMRYTPTPIDAIVVNIDGVDPKSTKQITRVARKLAIDIAKCYLSFDVSISITKIDVRGERFIFEVELSEEERQHKFFKESENVRIAMKQEYFKPVRDGLSLMIVVSEKSLQESSLVEILNDSIFIDSKMKILFAIGHDIMGEKVVEDLSKFPHILVGGTTGGGKSSALHSMLLSIVSKQSIDDVNLLVFDFGITFLSQFRNVPHLSHPIVYDMNVGFNVIMELRKELERRREIYHRNPDDRSEFNKLPSIFCIIDEFPKFIGHGVDRKKKRELQEAIRGILAESRGVKIHMILAAQDPTEENMKCGLTNIGTCLAFMCEKEVNSRVMIGVSGAEHLVGDGDMLFKPEGRAGIRSIQGSYIKEKAIRLMLEKMAFMGTGEDMYKVDESLTTKLQAEELSKSDDQGSEAYDEKLSDVIIWSLTQEKIANSRIQAYFRIANTRAKRILAQMSEWNLIKELHGNLGWLVLPQSIDDMPPDVTDFLEQRNHTRADILVALGKRSHRVSPNND